MSKGSMELSSGRFPLRIGLGLLTRRYLKWVEGRAKRVSSTKISSFSL
jgi:hypothetical protein